MDSGIEIEGFEDFSRFLGDMVLDMGTKRKAVREGINVVAKDLEENTPVGSTGELSEIKVTVRESFLAVEGIARSKAFYDIFQEFGTSEQKAHVGYFERSVTESEDEAVSRLARVIFNKMR